MRITKDLSFKDTVKELMQTKLLLAEINEKNGIKKCRNGKIKLPFCKLKYIADNYFTQSNKEIAHVLKLSINSVSVYAQYLGLTTLFLANDEITLNNLIYLLTGKNADSYTLFLLHKYNIPIYKQNSKQPFIINIYKFYEWYKQHIKLICIDKYIIGTLPNEPDWFIEKAKADKRAIQYINKRKWTQQEDDLLKSLVQNCTTYFECSKALKRTGKAIQRRCNDLRIKKLKRTSPVLWTDKELTELKRLWLAGYEPCIIAEEIGRSDREIIGYLERQNYFDKPTLKFK